MTKLQDVKIRPSRAKYADRNAHPIIDQKNAEIKKLKGKLAAHLRFSRDLSRSEREKASYLNILNQFSLKLSTIKTVHELVWYVVKEVVGKLGFQDCVLYTLSESGKTLIQRAAYGIKSPGDEILINALEIPLGQGITGSVAQNRRLELVNDVCQDDRYIVDFNTSGSELCVPIIFEHELFGVIDSESDQINFYKPHQVEILTTVASMTAARLSQIIQTNQLHLAKIEAEQAKFEAEKANQAKAKFLSMMSHEIRTPVSCVLGSLELMEAINDQEKRRQLERIALNNTRLLKELLDDLIELGKIENGIIENEIKTIHFETFLTQLKNVYQPIVQSKNIRFKLNVSEDSPKTIRAAQANVRQIIVNFLSNAVKFTDRGTIELFLRRNAQNRELLEIGVKDSGVGIPLGEQEKIFEDFYQVGIKRQKKLGGVGIGLALSKRLARAIGGEILISSQTKKGSTFLLKFQPA